MEENFRSCYPIKCHRILLPTSVAEGHVTRLISTEAEFYLGWIMVREVTEIGKSLPSLRTATIITAITELSTGKHNDMAPDRL